MEDLKLNFPRDFLWGTASAAYQIEGAMAEDGKGPGIWDIYSHTPGKIEDGTVGDIACDHYHRWRDDIKMLEKLGTNTYRFSISWPRVLPKGRGKVNSKGLKFYSNLVDGLLESGITPFVTLYHFDLPQALQDEGGGWLRRGIEKDFAEFVAVVSHELGDRVRHWATINEPWELAWQGYLTGEDAPGLMLDVSAALKASHNVFLSHGEAIRVLRENVSKGELGIVLHLNSVEPASNKKEDIEAANRWEGCQNRWYLDPLFKGSYPKDMWEIYSNRVPEVKPDDMELIGEPIDFLGINCYRRSVVATGSDLPPVNMKRVSPPGEYTEMGWEVYPEGLYKILKKTQEEYNLDKIYITENGSSFNDKVEDGQIHDERRTAYIREHVKQANRAYLEGVPLKGYFVWSNMDNFEWAYGFSRRFGVIHVDFQTQKRTIKDSGKFLSKLVKATK